MWRMLKRQTKFIPKQDSSRWTQNIHTLVLFPLSFGAVIICRIDERIALKWLNSHAVFRLSLWKHIGTVGKRGSVIVKFPLTQ